MQAIKAWRTALFCKTEPYPNTGQTLSEKSNHLVSIGNGCSGLLGR
jgi:hypothetical protein